jgi:hypothetical protein
MTIATKSGGLIVKDGKLAENCGCCNKYYCCENKSQFCQIASVSASVAASDWVYKAQTFSTGSIRFVNLDQPCASVFITHALNGSDANGTHLLSQSPGTNDWFGFINCGCWIYFRFLAPSFFYVGYSIKSRSQLNSFAEPSEIACSPQPTRSSYFQCSASLGCDNSTRVVPCAITVPSATYSFDCEKDRRIEVTETGSRIITVTFSLTYS